MLYGRRLDQSLQHVDGSRYALVHAVAKRARQITLWLTADPAELRAEAAPPPAPGELTSRDPVALAEAEILDGEVKVRWDPDGLDEAALIELDEIETDPLLIETLGDDEDVVGEADDDGAVLTPALAQVLEGEATDTEAASEDDEEDEAEPVDEVVVTAAIVDDDVEEISLDEVEEPDDDDETEDEV